MAKAVLFDVLRRAYKISQLAVQLNLPSADVTELRHTLSRRQFLHSSVVLAGAARSAWMGLGNGNRAILPREDRANAAWPPQTFSGQGDADSQTLIVGAGIAGLTAAYRLQQAGIAVDVIEATPRLGGRIRSLANASNIPTPVELGGEFIDSTHMQLRSLAQELGLQVVDLQTVDAGLIPTTLYFDGQQLNFDNMVTAFVPLAQRILKDLRRLGSWSLTYHTPPPSAVELDRISLADYLDASPTDPTLKKLLKVAYMSEFGREAEDLSCLNLLLMIGTNARQWQLYGNSDERYHIIGGNEQIPQRLAQALSKPVETGTALTSIRHQANGRYQVTLQQGLSSIERLYDRLLITIPFSALRQVELNLDLPPAKRQAIAQLGYGTGTKLLTPYQERIWKTRYRSTANLFTDLDFQNTWESTRYSTESKGWLANLIGGRQGLAVGQGNPETHAAAIATQLEALYPGIQNVRQGHPLRAYWTGEPYQQGSYSAYLLGQWTQFGGAEAERIGNLWFAGEHCSMIAQGFMEGACETGETAARSILQTMGAKPTTT